MAELDLAQKPMKIDTAEWSGYQLQVGRLKDQAQNVQQDATAHALKIAELAVSGKMGAFLHGEKSRIPSFVQKLRENSDEISVQLAHLANEKISDSPGKSSEIDIYSIRFEAKRPETLTMRLGENYTELSLAKGKGEKILEVARQSGPELTFEKYS